MANLGDGWTLAALAMFLPLIGAVIAAGRFDVPRRLIAIQFATSLSVLIFVVLSFAFQQPSSIDVALTVALLTLPGTLLLALFVERWL